MIADISENLVRMIILDISGVYAQIHNQNILIKLRLMRLSSNILILDVGEL